MIKLNKKLAVLPVLLALGVGYASAAENCAAKRASIEYQISQAKLYGNYYRVAGLQRALDKVNMFCNDNQLVDKAQKKVEKAEKKLAEKKEDILDIKADLRKAQAKGDSKKIRKYEKKLAEKQADVAKAQRELDEARAELNGLK